MDFTWILLEYFSLLYYTIIINIIFIGDFYGKKYKLEYIQTFDILDNKITKIILFFIWLIVVVFLIIVSISSPDISFLILLLAFAYSCMFEMILLIIYLPPRNNKNYEYLKNIGEKEIAYIVDAGFTRRNSYPHYNTYRRLFYITLLHEGKLVNIYKLKENNAFLILRVILDSYSYPVEKSLKIPIEIYRYNNKLYADLDSVDLSKLPGYEKAKKL